MTSSQQLSHPSVVAAATMHALPLKCRLCSVLLAGETGADHGRRLCSDCRRRPEARQLGHRDAPADFSPAEKGLILKLQGHLSAQQLLDVMNKRLADDRGASVVPHTLQQLHDHLRNGGTGLVVDAAGDWASLRKLLARARSSGLLATIDVQTVEAFAVVYALSPAQALRVKEIVLAAKDEGGTP